MINRLIAILKNLNAELDNENAKLDNENYKLQFDLSIHLCTEVGNPLYRSALKVSTNSPVQDLTHCFDQYFILKAENINLLAENKKLKILVVEWEPIYQNIVKGVYTRRNQRP